MSLTEMPASDRACASEALTPSSLTAPLDETQAALMLPWSSRITDLPVVEPKSIPST
jgi:hypothetical protein